MRRHLQSPSRTPMATIRTALAVLLAFALSMPATLSYAETPELSDEVEASGGIGQISLTAISSLPNITDANRAYSFEGATFVLYTDGACTTEVATLVLDSSGAARLQGIAAGTYYLRQTLIASGYAALEDVRKVEVASDKTTDVDIALSPKHASAGLLVRMENAETRNAAPAAGATLSGALFEISYFDVSQEDIGESGSTSIDNATPSRTWVFQSDASGEVLLDEKHFVKGDRLFTDESGLHTLALGRYSIRETSPSNGYLACEDIHTFDLADDAGAEPAVPFSQTQTFSCQVLRGDLSFQKVNEAGEGLAGIPFLLSSLDENGEVLEQHVVTTGEEGWLTTSSIAHSTNTNANDSALVKGDDKPQTADSAKLRDAVGTWFSQDTQGAVCEPDDEAGALPFGTYRLEELSCSANWGMTLVNTVFSIREKGEVVDLGQLVDRAPALVTWAHDASDADKRIPAEKGAAVQDSVEITNLIEGSSYELRTTLIDAETKEQLTDAQGTPVEALTPFVAEETSTVLKAALSFDADDLAGKKLVVVEELLLEDIIVATNADSVSEDQTVSVLPTITTSARDKADGDSYVTSTQATIVDEVTYDGLVVGQVYKLDALLMDKATGNVARDGNGDAISGSREFVCEHETGSVDVEITLDTSLVGGHDIVVYEKLRQADNTELAAHEDIDDAAQTLKTSGLDTKASDSADGDEYYNPSAESVTISDTVSLSNIETGKEYTLTATLMDKTSETALESNGAKVRSTKTFVADKAYDTVEMELVFSPAEYAASDVVVYEVLSFEGNEVARHTDIDDEDQTVSSLTTATSVAEAEGEAADGADEATGTGKVGDETSSEGKTGYVATGDATQLAFVVLLAALLATASAMRAMRFRRALMDSPARNGRCPP